jgi:outer membrane biosynthesis protein TonB
VSDEDPAEEEEASEPEPVVKKTGRKHQAARKTAPPSKKRKIPEPEPEEEQEEEEDEIEEEEDELAPSQPVKAKKAAKAKPRVTAETNSEEATSIKSKPRLTYICASHFISVQLLPAKKGQQGEILDISVGDGILVNGKAGDHGRPGSYDDNVDMPCVSHRSRYWNSRSVATGSASS